MGILKFLFFFIVSLYLIRLLARLLLPYLMKRMMQKAQRRFGEQFGQPFQAPYNHQAQQNRPEGEIRIEHIPEKKKTRRPGKDGAGEFVDFEEVK